MCPPFTPSASQFKGCLSRYRKAILVEVEDRIPQNVRRPLSGKEKWYAELIKDKSFLKQYDEWHVKVWRVLMCGQYLRIIFCRFGQFFNSSRKIYSFDLKNTGSSP